MTSLPPTFVTKSDSMGSLQVPSSALFGAQTQRAVENFPYGPSETLPEDFIKALALLKLAAARANCSLGLLSPEISKSIVSCAEKVFLHGRSAFPTFDNFPVSIFQTGSGTSSNMNMNEVLSQMASKLLSGSIKVHPNDHVNCSQSSNDTIPT